MSNCKAVDIEIHFPLRGQNMVNIVRACSLEDAEKLIKQRQGEYNVTSVEISESAFAIQRPWLRNGDAQ